MAGLKDLLNEKKTIIVVGPGGVGKTTTAASFAVQGARAGLKVLVLTVDPARRLANSLGLEALGNEEVEIDPKLFADAEVELSGGSLYAMMLDTKRTFDDLIRRHAPSKEIERRIFANPLYEQTSSALAGSQEYMAMEKLYEVREARDYDLIVLDTPPTANALDFLDAASRLEDFLDSGSIKLMLRGAKGAGRVGLGFLKVNRLILRGLNRFVGADVFLNLLEFIESFSEMYSGFKDRAQRVRKLLRSDEVGFVVVSSPEQAALDEGLFFYRQLAREGMPFAAMLINRVRRMYLQDHQLDGLAADLKQAISNSQALALYDQSHMRKLADVTAEACADYDILTRVDQRRVRETREALGGDGDKLWPVPLFDRDIHDIRSLAAFGDAVYAGMPEVE